VKLRYLGVAACGGSAFIDMYATQPLLPELRTTFHASEAAVSSTITVLTRVSISRGRAAVAGLR